MNKVAKHNAIIKHHLLILTIGKHNRIDELQIYITLDSTQYLYLSNTYVNITPQRIVCLSLQDMFSFTSNKNFSNDAIDYVNMLVSSLLVFFLLFPFLRELLTHQLHQLIILLPMIVKT